jgi:HK97 family phage major capsid protein
MAGTVAAGANVILAGDFSRYIIVDRIGMSVQYVPQIFGANQRPTGQSGWVAYWRVGADCADPNAFRLLQLNTVLAATPLA